MALTELLAALEGERRTHAAATRAGQTRQDNTTMREPTTPTAPGEMLGERVALIHEEATELLAHIREGDLTSAGERVALADIVIRCLDYAGRYEIDLGRLIATKMRHNRTRTHRHGGKVL